MNNPEATRKRPVGKVSFAKWEEIRAKAASGMSVLDIAARLNLSEKTVSEIIAYKRDATDAR